MWYFSTRLIFIARQTDSIVYEALAFFRSWSNHLLAREQGQLVDTYHRRYIRLQVSEQSSRRSTSRPLAHAPPTRLHQRSSNLSLSLILPSSIFNPSSSSSRSISYPCPNSQYLSQDRTNDRQNIGGQYLKHQKTTKRTTTI